jgi:hypothetical protein
MKISKDKKDDPICGSAGCTQYKFPDAKPGHPIDYPVPNFGMDHDIKATEASIKQAEGSVDHVWKPTENKDGTWNVPTALAPRSLASLEDSPSCSSDDGSL